MTRFLRFALLFSLFSLAPPSAIAYEMERAVANLSHELSTCAGFLLIVSKAMEGRDAEVADSYKSAGFNMHQMAIELSNEKVATARMEMSIKDMAEELDGDTGNISILLARHLEPCQAMSNDIGPRLQYWLDKED